MHTGQIMLVQAENHDEAIDTVTSKLEDYDRPEWSDWHGGFDGKISGRWSEVFGSSHPDESMRYADDPELAERIIKEFLGARKSGLDFALSQFPESFNLLTIAKNYDPLVGFDTEDPEQWKEFMTMHYAKSAIQILANEWTCDTGVYDLEESTGNLSYFRKRLEDPAKKEQAHLVIVDFHF